MAEQTLTDRSRLQVVVVDDGSTDGMADAHTDLRGEGLVDEVIRLRHRSGKNAAVCSGDVIAIADIDTTFDRDALAVMLGYFAADPADVKFGDLADHRGLAKKRSKPGVS